MVGHFGERRLFGKLAWRSRATARLAWPETQNAKQFSNAAHPPNTGTFGPFQLRVLFEAT